MKNFIGIIVLLTTFTACQNWNKEKLNLARDIKGTWQLKSSFAITKGDTLNTTPAKGIAMQKMINDSHFSFASYDLKHGKDSSALFSAGGGTYTLQGDEYQENLNYCSARDWEGHQFKFKVTLNADTLEQKGIEKIDSLDIDREIIERYVRVQ